MANRGIFCALLFFLLANPLFAGETGGLSDPLRPVRYQAPAIAAVAEQDAVKTQNWRLSAVLISAERSVAVINGQSLQVGDHLAGYQLSKIEAGKVILRNKQKQIVLHRSGTGLKKSALSKGVVKGSQP